MSSTTVKGSEVDGTASDDDVRVWTPRKRRRSELRSSDEDLVPAAPRKKRLRRPGATLVLDVSDVEAEGGDDDRLDDEAGSMSSFIVGDSEVEAEEQDSAVYLAMDALKEQRCDLDWAIAKLERRLKLRRSRLLEVERQINELAWGMRIPGEPCDNCGKCTECGGKDCDRVLIGGWQCVHDDPTVSCC